MSLTNSAKTDRMDIHKKKVVCFTSSPESRRGKKQAMKGCPIKMDINEGHEEGEFTSMKHLRKTFRN
jgi:hypothetical protein